MIAELPQLDVISTSGGLDDVIIPLCYTIVRDSDGTIPGPAITEQVLAEVTTHLNTTFVETSFTFETCNITYIDSDEIFENPIILDNPNTPDDETRNLFDFSYCESAINIYFYDSPAAFATQPTQPEPNNLIFAGYVYSYPWNRNILTHEMGHIFGLLHTHGATTIYQNPPPQNYTDHPYDGELPRELVIREDMPGSGLPFPTKNCDTAGDLLCDTPADGGFGANLGIFYPNPNDPLCTDNDPLTFCSSGIDYDLFTCVYTGTYIDYNNQPITPLLDNYMSYYNSCISDFTDQQVTRMEAIYELHRADQLDANFCANLFDEINYRDESWTIKNVNMTFSHPNDLRTMQTISDINGQYSAILYEEDVMVNLVKLGSGDQFSYTYDDWNPSVFVPSTGQISDAVTTADIVALRRILLGIDVPNGYELLAGDVNASNTISTFDIVLINKLILEQEIFPDLSSPYKFIPEYITIDYATEFNDDPFALFNAQYLEPDWQYSITDGTTNNNGYHAVIAGDVNGAGDPLENFDVGIPDSRNNSNSLYAKNHLPIEKGDLFTATFTIGEIELLGAYQFGLFVDSERLELIDVHKGALPDFDKNHFGLTKLSENEFRTLWYPQDLNAIEAADGKTIFKLKFRAKEDVKRIEDVVRMDNEVLKAYFYNEDFQETEASISLDVNKSDSLIDAENVELVINPSPINDEMNVMFNLLHKGNGELLIYNIYGEVVYSAESLFESGRNSFTINTSQLSEGFYIVQVKSGNQTLTKKILKSLD